MGWIESILKPPSRVYDIWTDASAWTHIGGVSNYVGGKKPAAGIEVDYHTALNCAAVLACTRAIAETLATLPALVYENMPDESREKARQNPLWRLCHDQPNPDMDSVTFYGMQTKRLVNRGNAYSLIEYNEREEPIALWPVHNSRIKPMREKYTYDSSGRMIGGRLYYNLYMKDDPNDPIPLDPRHVLNVVGFDSEDGITACGVIPRAKEEISLDTAAQEFSGSIYGNGAMPLGIVSHPGWISDETKRSTFRSDVNTVHQGRENWNKVGIMWDGATWQKLGFSPDEVKSIDGRRLSSKLLCMYYGVPPGIVQIFDDFKFATVEAMLKQFVMLTIRPYAVRWEKALGTQVFSRINGDLFLEFALEGLLRGDPKSQADANAVMRQWGAMNADEWRAQFNWNKLPNGMGQKYIVPMNYTTLDKAGEAAIKGNVASFEPDKLAAAIGEERAQRRIGYIPAPSGRKRKTIKLRTYALEVITDAIQRMASNERNAIQRAVKKPEFIPWLDDYHSKFQLTLSESLVLGVRGWMTATNTRGDCKDAADKLATYYVNTSKEALLTACECQEAELEQSITASTETWPRLEITDELLKGFCNA
jgi:HK97 family phage portal protein